MSALKARKLVLYTWRSCTVRTTRSVPFRLHMAVKDPSQPYVTDSFVQFAVYQLLSWACVCNLISGVLQKPKTHSTSNILTCGTQNLVFQVWPSESAPKWYIRDNLIVTAVILTSSAIAFSQFVEQPWIFFAWLSQQQGSGEIDEFKLNSN